MSSRARLDRRLAVGLVGSLLIHGAAISAVALVRLDPTRQPIQVELVQLEPTTVTSTPSVTRREPRKAASLPEPTAPGLPEPPAAPDRTEPRVSVTVSTPTLPERVIAPRAQRRASDEAPALPAPPRERPEGAMVRAGARPERPTGQVSQPTVLPTHDATPLPAEIERRAIPLSAGASRRLEQPDLAFTEPSRPGSPAGQPTVALGQPEPSAEQHLSTLLSSRTPNMDSPAGEPAPPSPHVSGPGSAAASTPAPAVALTPAPVPSVTPAPPPGSNQLQAALPPRAGNAGAFIAPRLAYPRKPRYPEAARQAGIEGTVLVKAHVLADGSVREAEVTRSAGNAALDGAALQTIRESRFTPAERGGRRVAVWVEIPVDFKLER